MDAAVLAPPIAQIKPPSPPVIATAAAATAPAPAPVPAASATTGTPPLKTPDWVKDAVFYQIFPERFDNGDLGNDLEGVRPWGTAPTRDNLMGGDLEGVRRRLDYLQDLGVNALYLNPVFKAPSSHKYNTTDYENVDESFGGNRALKDLVDDSHARGMKVMLDGVFNHVSHQHPWFRDVREKGPASEYWDRFEVNKWPISYHRDADGQLRSPDYKSWWGFSTIPELKTTHPAVQEYFLTGKDSITKRWLRDSGIDGWRMDVADEVEPEFWKAARTAIKSENPDAYLLAENWHDASSMLQGDQFDGAMNYKHFTWPATKFFGNKSISADEFASQLTSPYSKEARQAMFNILDSHDTERYATAAGGDWFRQRPAAIFQMTYEGAPVIYYGDEVGMQGANDPDSRRTFPWDAPQSWNRDLHGLYKRLIEVRKDEPALRRGDFSVLSTHNDNQTIAYRRHLEGEQRDAIVAINSAVAGRDIHVPTGGFAADGTAYVDALSGARHLVEGGGLTLRNVDGNYGAVLLREAADAVS